MYAQHIAIISLVGIAYLCPPVQMNNLICRKDVGKDLCAIHINLHATYCEAHEICEKEGKKRGLRMFIPGNNAPKMVSFFSVTGTVFTSFNAMLNRTTDRRAGWRVGDPGYAKFVTTKGDTTIPWHTGEPNADGPTVGLYIGRELFDDLQDYRNATSVICETSLRATGGKLERFQANWPYELDNLFVRNEYSCGCFKSIKANTLIACAKRCKQRTECRSLYFNEKNKECMLSLYVDSLLPMRSSVSPGAWVRFGRPDW
ncbi:hypothetical protein D915_009502 [Fasciola hepatica]|uniref:Apple domain-containing protein n=1 Tax=Fasciola hepatica TaxID=6192 RepID=A0A4E0QX78_FASHE|nr:hypothetical protein D915_009502 [Fasciola hepatica]